MAIYHAQIKSFSRGKGESSTAAAAYRAGVDIVDTRSRTTHRFSRRSGVESHHMLAPKGAPPWCYDIHAFWDANEAFESRANARVARELEVSLPNELTPAAREKLALALGQLLVDRYNAVVLAGIHAPGCGGDQRNHHVHLLMSARQVGAGGLGARGGSEFDARGGRGAEEIRVVRALVSQEINSHLKAAGIAQTVDHRSLRDQATAAAAVGDHQKVAELTRRPGFHIGRFATAQSRKEQATQMINRLVVRRHIQAGDAATLAAQEGRLVATPPSHGHEAALRDRAREAGSGAQPQAAPRHAAVQSPVSVAHRLARIARSTGKDADVLNAEAELIEQWLASLQRAADESFRNLDVIPGLRYEPAYIEAIKTLRCRRVGVYGKKPFFFDDSEALKGAIGDYVQAMRRPYDAREQLQRARAQLTEKTNPSDPGTATEVARARRVYWHARSRLSQRAKRAQERKINEARKAMIDARNHVERCYYITSLDPKDHEPVIVETAPVEDTDKKSDSNKRQLRPPTKPWMQSRI